MGTQTIRSTMMALALGGLALLGAATGCSSDDYYCDSTGCYYCDGVGCRAAVPPTRPVCQGDYQCGTGQTCTNLGCTVGCTTDGDCAQGWVCRGASGSQRGYCVTPTERSPTPNPGACTSNAQCMGGAICVNGTCAQSTCNSATTSCACTTSAQCASGQSCVGGRCEATTDTCRFNSQCGAGRVCLNQQCLAACSATVPCPTNQVCGADGVCADRPNQCVRDTDCGAGSRCVNAVCLARCTANAECGTGRFCSDGVCITDTRRQPFCTTDAQCAAGSRCLDGLCRRPCSTADECLRTDVQYRNCAPIRYLNTTQSYCQTNNEFQSDCARAADCAAGQSCTDGVCRS